MALSSDIISQFAKLTKSDKPASKAETVYGTIVEYDGSKYVKLDGSDLLTPVSSTTNAEADERVTVMIKDHTATVTGNLSSPAARTAEVSAVGSKISEFETIVADKVDTKELVAAEARIKTLEADNVTINKTLVANQASIKELETDKLSAESADLKYANIDFSNIGKATMEYFYATSGLIKNVTVGDQTITGNLVGVTISGDLIEGNTIVAEKLVIKGDDGLYYKLNTDGMNVEAQQTDYNSLNGSIIKAKSITATKISVSDLVAFDATIGGFNITDSALYSGTKASVGNTTRGVYLDKTGQIAFGDSINYIKYFKDADGSYKLAISADVICMSSGKNIGSVVEDLENRIIENGSNATYVQFTQPAGTFNVGDIWVKAVDKTTWSTLIGKTWADVRGSLWGEIGYSDEPVTYVWNGSKWVLTVDYNTVKNNSTSITQTRNEITSKADKTTVTALSERVTNNSTEIKQTAEAITSKADQSVVDSLSKTVSNHSTQIEQTAEAITSKADQSTVDSLSRTVTNHSTQIEQNAEAIELKANKTDAAGKVVTSSVKIDNEGVEMSGGEIAVKAGAAVRIESGGTFEVESDNFNVTAEGNVSMKDAVVSGNLSQDGYSVLTKRDIVISSTQPTGRSNMIWIKPVSSTTLTYNHGVSVNTNFSVYNTAQKLKIQGSTAAGSGTYLYTMYVPYKTRIALDKTRTLTVKLTGSNGKTVTMATSLSNNAGYTGLAELSTTSTVWLGDATEISFTMTLTADETSQDYDYHLITPGTIQLVCTARSNATSGWSSAEVYVYQ